MGRAIVNLFIDILLLDTCPFAFSFQFIFCTVIQPREVVCNLFGFWKWVLTTSNCIFGV